MTTFFDTIREAQHRGLDQMKAAQEQLANYNEQFASTVVEAMPEFPTPFSEYLPRPVEMAESYYAFASEIQEANRQFVLKMLAPWDRPRSTEGE
ncbi:MAG: hypothetical protein AAF467_08955 [Actinomycetota bacterium]